MHINVIRDNALAIKRLNDNAAWALNPAAMQEIDGLTWTGEEVVQAAVNALTYSIESYYGFGFNSAGRTMCKHITEPVVVGLLIAYGVTPRAYELHGQKIIQRIRKHGQD